ncbi:hypothetical protein ACJIZ3_009954 [Penstemon smallii]|uniref:SKP1-like protein n=1 Tax=Penstemon smallii TaxID=265156 RepID=A0ABD3TGA5_9LAMI
MKSNDDRKYFVKKSVIVKFVTIKNLIDDGCADDGGIIPLHNVNETTLLFVIDYLNKHAESSYSEIKTFDEKFVEDLSHENVFNLIIVANYLDIKERFARFSIIVNDFTKEKKVAVRGENAWACEDINKDTRVSFS